ncbi:MAG: S-methyl-5-thioribose-1-phosphate isomerase [Treponema sp.]|nr:S-methyl-5-thioribose-1-phosphate isomerase [Treponema sp.]
MISKIPEIDTVELHYFKESDDRKQVSKIPFLKIIDQTLLPGKIEFLYLSETEEIREAIYLLKVRGAPAIGVAAAIGIYVIAERIETENYEEFFKSFDTTKARLASARPTAVNLFWALERMAKVVTENREAGVKVIKGLLKKEAENIRDEDIEACRKIGEHGLSLIKDGDGILTHCNAGRLATVRYGTALAPIHLGREKGYNFRVYTDETRPLLQGARLSAFELYVAGVDTTLICDNMASTVMKKGLIQAVFVGCDRLAANGDVCNKIGTSGVAILAKHYGIPFYSFLPVSTIDMSLKTGDDIVIEERDAGEVTDMWYKEPMAPKGVKVFNPAFDVTDNELITAIVTERGIIRPPFDKGLRDIMGANP